MTVQLSRTARQDLPDGVIDLAAGDVRAPFPHPEISRRLIGPADQPYPATAGTRALREQIAATAAADVTADDVLVTPGARAAVFLTLLPASGREVLLPTPRWGSYPAMAAMAGAHPVSYGPHPSIAALDAARTAASAVVVINSPRNPDGAVVDAATITGVLDWAARHHITVLFDQVYRGVSTTPTPSPLDVAGALPDHVVVVDGLSKSHAAAGLRLGWAIASAPLPALTAAASHLVGGVSTRVQQAGLATLSQPAGPRTAAVAALRAQTLTAAARLNAVDGIRCPPPAAGFFLFPHLRERATALPADVAGWLRDVHRVAVVDGAAFGAPGHLRLSAAVDPPTLATGLDRLVAALTAPGRTVTVSPAPV